MSERRSGRTSPKGGLSRAAEFDIQTALVRLIERVRIFLDRVAGPRIVTLDVGVDSIRLLEMSGGRVRRWASGTLEEGLIEGSMVAHRRVLGQRVQQLMDSSGIKAKKVVASVNGLYSISRFVTLPGDTAGRPMREVVEELAEEAIPVARDRIHLSWQPIASVPGESRVLMVGVPTDVIDSQVRSLRMAGINPHQIELRAMALARLVDRETAITLNLDVSALDVVVTVDGAPEAMRTVAWRSGAITVEDRAEQAALVVEMTLGYFETYHPEIVIDEATPVLVAGQLADDPALVEALATRLDYPVELLPAPVECPPFLSFAEYAVNIGLALKASVSPGKRGGGNRTAPDMNLLPDEYSPWRPSVRQVLFAAVTVVGLVLLFPAYQLTTGALADTRVLEADKARVERELADKQAILQERAPLQLAVNGYNQIVGLGGNFSRDLAAIYDGAAELGVSVIRVNHKGDTVSVVCEAGSSQAFRGYLTALEDSGRFATPIPPPPGYPEVTGGTIEMEPVAPE